MGQATSGKALGPNPLRVLTFPSRLAPPGQARHAIEVFLEVPRKQAARQPGGQADQADQQPGPPEGSSNLPVRQPGDLLARQPGSQAAS